jgi:hypothetical protein
LEPENHALEVRQAFEKVVTPMKLALIGDAPYAHDYIRRVRDTEDPRIVMPGAIYGAGYHELGSHCFAYIHATEVGGTHPALIEAMGRGALVLYRDTPENAEVAGDTDPFAPDDRQASPAAHDEQSQPRNAAAGRRASASGTPGTRLQTSMRAAERSWPKNCQTVLQYARHFFISRSEWTRRIAILQLDVRRKVVLLLEQLQDTIGVSLRQRRIGTAVPLHVLDVRLRSCMVGFDGLPRHSRG